MLTRNKRIKGRCLFPNPNASVLSQYGSIFRFIPPQVVGGHVRPATPLFLPPTCHRQAYGGNPNTVPVPMGKRPRALPFVRQRLPRPTRQTASHADFASVRLRHHRNNTIDFTFFSKKGVVQ